MAPMKPESRRRAPTFAGTFSLAQLARRWKISAKDVRRMLGRQQLAFVQICGSLRVPLAEVERFERQGRS